MRGLFAARSLAQLEAVAKEPITDYFTVFAGTSIGGIIAIALATGVRPADIEAAIRHHGPKIFKRSAWKYLDPFSLWHTPYNQKPLKQAITTILGERSDMRLSDVGVPLLVPAVDFVRAMPRIFASPPLALPGDNLDISLMDVALATSAAPTFLPPHRVGGDVFIDGGLIANLPDMTAAQRCVDRTSAQWNDVRILSVGTAAYDGGGDVAIANPGRKGWLVDYNLFGVTIDAQARLALDVAKARLKERLYRLDYPTTRSVDLDDADQESLDELSIAADEAVSRFQKDKKAWARFMTNLTPP